MTESNSPATIFTDKADIERSEAFQDAYLRAMVGITCREAAGDDRVRNRCASCGVDSEDALIHIRPQFAVIMHNADIPIEFKIQCAHCWETSAE